MASKTTGQGVALCLLVFLLAACSTGNKTLYHTLDAGMDVRPARPDASAGIASLGVGPVDLPTLLDREGIVIRKDAYSVEVSDTHNWGGQLEDEFLRALSRQLQMRLPRTRVQTIPWEMSQTPQYQIAVGLDQFDGAPGGLAILRGQWRLQQARDGKIIATHPIQLQQAVGGKTVEDIVRAQSRLVAELAARMTEALAAR